MKALMQLITIILAVLLVCVAGRLEARTRRNFLPLFANGDGDSAASGESSGGSAQEALRRVEAVENLRSSRVLCRLAGSEGEGFATVRLQPANNARSLVFNDDVAGVETMVECSGEPGPECLAVKAPDVAHDISECEMCPCQDNKGRLFGAYAIAMASEVDKRCSQAVETFRVLLLGLGGGELATHIIKKCNGVQFDAVELDSRLPVLAQRYFGLPDSLHVTIGDAGPVVASLREQVAGDALLAHDKQYDVILVDCFSTGGVTPEHCRAKSFLDDLHQLLRSGGVVLHHMWHKDDQHAEVPQEFAATVSEYKTAFGCSDCAVSVKALEGPDSIIVASTSTHDDQ